MVIMSIDSRFGRMPLSSGLIILLSVVMQPKKPIIPLHFLSNLAKEGTRSMDSSVSNNSRSATRAEIMMVWIINKCCKNFVSLIIRKIPMIVLIITNEVLTNNENKKIIIKVDTHSWEGPYRYSSWVSPRWEGPYWYLSWVPPRWWQWFRWSKWRFW